MDSNELAEVDTHRRTLRERLGLWLLRADRPIPPTLTQLQADFVQLRLEWADTVDFIQHWAGRQSKRDQKALKVKLSEAEPSSEPLAPLPGPQLSKAELRGRAAALRGANGHHHIPGRADT